MTTEAVRMLFAVLYGAIGVSVAAAGIGVAHRRTVDRTVRWLVAWLVADAIASVVGTVGAIQFQNAQYAAQVWYPISAWLALRLLASTLGAERSRRAAIAMAWIVAVVIVVLSVTVEQFGGFAKINGVIHGMTLLIVGAALVLQRSRKARGDMFADNIFMIGTGFVLMGAPSAFLAIGVRFTGADQVYMHLVIFTLKGLLAITAYLLMVIAIHLAATRERRRVVGAAV